MNGLNICTAVGTGMLLLGAGACRPSGDRDSIVVYCSQDLVYAEPLLRRFARETGVEVKTIYDAEAVKTGGLAQRLILEQARPQCDLFWNNEELRTRQLEARGVLASIQPWVGFGYRTRRLVYHTAHEREAGSIRDFASLTNRVWKGRIALAYPQFGTTATHFLALRAAWGKESWEEWCRALMANKPFLVDGNSVVVQLVASGRADIGLTDFDDVMAGLRAGHPVAMLPVFPDGIAIQNTCAIIRNPRGEDEARRLAAWLSGPDAARELIGAQAIEGMNPAEINVPILRPPWTEILAEFEEGMESLRRIFLR